MQAVLHGPLGRTMLGPDKLTIGYDPDNQLIVTDIKTAAHHALIHPDGTGYAIVDLGSAYGTQVNGQWLSPNVARPLESGDTIQIGDSIFTYDTSFLPPVAVDAHLNGAQAPAFELAAGVQKGDRKGRPYNDYGTGYGPVGFLTSEPAVQVVASSPITSPQVPYTPQPWVSGGVTEYPAQAQLWRRDRRRTVISLGILLIVLVVGFALVIALNRSTPDKTLDTFCNALLSGNGQLAFNQFSNNYQTQFTQTNPFLTIRVTACTHTSAVVNGGTATASITVVVAQTPQPSSSSTVTLVQDANGAWKIDSLQGLQSPGPDSNG